MVVVNATAKNINNELLNHKRQTHRKSPMSFEQKTTIKNPKKRSRNGCISCKKMKIKCNEGKPVCEYCLHTQRECCYVLPPTRKQMTLAKAFPKEDQIYVDSLWKTPSSRTLNSTSNLMSISNFEVRLLKYFLDFGGKFFTFNMHSSCERFWSEEVPKLWCTSDLIKAAIYTISSTKLLGCYEGEDIKNIHLELDHECQNNILTNDQHTKINLLEATLKYSRKTTALISHFNSLLPEFTSEIEDVIGELFIGNTILLGSKCVSPGLSTYGEIASDMTKCGVINMMDHGLAFHTFSGNFFPMISRTKYELVLKSQEKLPVKHENTLHSFFFIDYLKTYVAKKAESLDILQISYFNAISLLESGSEKALLFKYPLPLFWSLVDMSSDADFLEASKTGQHTALKIIFLFSCLCSLFLKLSIPKSIWAEFIEFYVTHSFKTFGSFEDEFDENIYETVQKRREGKYPWGVQILPSIGKPVDQINYVNINYDGPSPTSVEC